MGSGHTPRTTLTVPTGYPLEPWRIWTQLGVVAAALGLASGWPPPGRSPVLRVVAGCVAAMAGYGALQDQFTARLCPEYFTVAHQPIPGVTDPTVLGLAWGFLGGWWGGLLLGLGVARAGDIARAVAALLAAVGAVSALACAGNLHNADLLGVSVGEPWASRVPAERHRALVAVANTHFAAYTTTTVGGVVACAWVARRRFGA